MLDTSVKYLSYLSIFVHTSCSWEHDELCNYSTVDHFYYLIEKYQKCRNLFF